MIDRDRPDPRAVTTLTAIVALAISTTVVAVAAGLVLLIVDVEAGSNLEAALGLTAAISGIVTGVLWAGAAVYAQIKGLWGFAPQWFRIAVVVVLGGLLLITLFSGNGI